MSSFTLESAETGFTRFTKGHFSELIKKDVGGEGVLYAAKHDIHGEVMVKVFTSPNNKYSGQEVRILVKVICHQNIVRILGSFYFEDGTDAMRSGYVMEFMANGSLSAVIHNLSIEYNDNQVYSWIQQAGRGIAYLHSQKIIHRDVNTRNMLLGETIDILKISDFGSAKPDATVTKTNTCFMGTNRYMAPEVIGGKGVNSAADVYSLGISTWEMFHRNLGNMIIKGTRPKIELRMEEEMKDLILRSLEAQSKLRPKAIDFTTIAVKLRNGTNVSPSAPKAQKASLVESMSSLMKHVSQYFSKKPTSPSHDASKAQKDTLATPSRSLSSEIQNSFDTELTLLIGGIRGNDRPHKTILAFEHTTKTWKDLDVGIPDIDICGEAVVLNEELYAIGGEIYTSGEEKSNMDLFKLNPENRSWMKLTHIPNEQVYTFVQSVAYGNKIYVVLHAWISQCRPKNTIFAYDPVTNSWSKLAPIKETIILAGITVYNNKLYTFGKSEENSCMEAGYYDTGKDEWEYLSLGVPLQLVSFTRAVTYKNELVFFVNHDVYASNLDGRTPCKTLPRLKSRRYTAAVFTCGNSLFAAGGHNGPGQLSDEVESFDGTTWTEMPRMPYGVIASTSVTATGDLAKQLLKWSRNK